MCLHVFMYTCEYTVLCQSVLKFTTRDHSMIQIRAHEMLSSVCLPWNNQATSNIFLALVDGLKCKSQSLHVAYMRYVPYSKNWSVVKMFLVFTPKSISVIRLLGENNVGNVIMTNSLVACPCKIGRIGRIGMRKYVYANERFVLYWFPQRNFMLVILVWPMCHLMCFFRIQGMLMLEKAQSLWTLSWNIFTHSWPHAMWNDLTCYRFQKQTPFSWFQRINLFS